MTRIRPITREAEEQLKNARRRNSTGRADGFLYEAERRLTALQNALNTANTNALPELRRHVPVSAVAALESQFKAIVIAIVDSGPVYLERGLKLIRESLKPSSDIVVEMLHRKALSVGELVAYASAFNTVADIEKTFGALLDGDLKAMVARVVDPLFVRRDAPRQEPIVNNVDTLWRDLSLTFERRHILAHEAASTFEVTHEQAQVAIACIRTLASALDALLWNTAWATVPLTQREMNDDAWQRYRSTRHSLVRYLRRANRIATERGERRRFRIQYLALVRALREWAAWEEEAWTNGSIRPMMAASSLEVAAKARIEALRGWLSTYRPEEAPDAPVP